MAASIPGQRAGVPAPVRRLAERGGGRPLPTPVRAMMDSRFDYRFSGVKVHDGALAAQAASSVGAVAYILGT